MGVSCSFEFYIIIDIRSLSHLLIHYCFQIRPDNGMTRALSGTSLCIVALRGVKDTVTGHCIRQSAKEMAALWTDYLT